MQIEKNHREQTMRYIVEQIKYVCETFKNRLPGSQPERDSQDYMAGELKKWADEVKSEDFELHPLGFMGFIPLCAVFGVASAIMFFCQRRFEIPALTIIPILLMAASLLMFVFEFLLYREFVDFLFPKKVSRNVYAVRKSLEEPTRRIVFGGHADAAHEWTYSRHGQIKTLAPAIGGSVLGMFFIFISSIIYVIAGFPALTGGWSVVSWLQLAMIPFFIMIFFFINWKVVVDGANDNLSACYVSMGIMKEMAESGFRFKNTEVCVLITGSEEAGLRGALAFGKKHAEELNKIETVIIPLETLRETSELAIYSLDQTGMVRNDKQVAKLLENAGKNVGINLPHAQIYPGSTDAAGFTRTGLKSCGLGGVNHNPQTYYHTRMDSWDNISEECMEKSLEICVEAAKLFDENGLPE